MAKKSTASKLKKQKPTCNAFGFPSCNCSCSFNFKKIMAIATGCAMVFGMFVLIGSMALELQTTVINNTTLETINQTQAERIEDLKAENQRLKNVNRAARRTKIQPQKTSMKSSAPSTSITKVSETPKPELKKTCVDTDGGIDLFFKGKVVTAKGPFEHEKIDECLSETSVQEYMCNPESGSFSAMEMTCPDGGTCSEGKCSAAN